MKYGLFLGCNVPAVRPDVERAIRLSMPRLGAEMLDLEGSACCPAFGSFPSADETASLAVSAWNFSIAEELGVPMVTECGSCYSSLRMALEKLRENGGLREKVQGLLREKAGREFRGTASVRHIIDVLHNDMGTDRIRASIDRPVTGMSAVVQYPCHTLFPSEVVGFEESSGRPRMLRGLVEALGIEVRPYSRELQCCGGAGGFVKGSFAGASEFAFRKLRAIKAETDADLIVVSCITCLEHLDRMQAELAKKDPSFVPLPVFDYNQLLAVCMGFDPAEVASISTIPREAVVERIRGAGR
ncbi:MAG: CoB--CoM heterodisulfide reductase iron-sulfur subunit B family protein [Candidatus Fermentibacter sp.]|nr:CoB--CoM heterodisulfide reductase iron-sulfur subunit B family protein [Candidatus Fermentibacter sp.]